MSDSKKVGRPSTKPVSKRKAFYISIKVRNSMNGTETKVLVSRDTKAEVKQLLMRSPQETEFLGFWNGKSFEKVNLN